MASLATSDAVTRLIDRVGSSGRVGRELAVRVDIVRWTGLAHAWRRLRYDANLSHLNDRAKPYKRIWVDAARELGAEVMELPADLLEIRADGAWTRVQKNLVMLDDPVTLELVLQKSLVLDLLTRAGLPVPDSAPFDALDLSPALAFLEAGPTPCVVKAVGTGGGDGVTSGIRTESDLMRARLRASRIDRQLMIERQAAGDFYRFLILDGKLLDVIRRRPPRVFGDGRSTIEQLIAAENTRRIERRREVLLRPLRVDLDCILTLERFGLTLSTVLPAGAEIAVKTVNSQNTIGDNDTVRTGVAPEIVEDAIAAADVAGLRLAGVDIITTDLSRSLRSTGGVILEVNARPTLNYHYEVADKTAATRVAVPVLQALLKDSRARSLHA